MTNEIFKRLFSSIILIPLVLFCIVSGSFIFNFFLTIILLISIFEWYNLAKKHSYLIFGILYLFFSFFYAYRLRVDQDNDYFLFLIVTSVCVLTDIGGYVFGNLFKGPKLTKFSPNKTYSGLIGSYFAAASVNSDEDEDAKSLLKLNKEGKWLLLLETPLDVDLPWEYLKKANSLDLIRLNDQ